VRALVVDAEPARRRALEEELTRHGHAVTALADAGAAEAHVREEQPPLVVVATSVGGDGGLGFVHRVQELMPAGEPPILVVVGPAGEVEPLAALEAGATDVWGLEEEERAGVAVRLSLAEHYARLQAENVRLGGEFALLRQALDLTGTGFILTDPGLEDNPIVYANESFYAMTGYTERETLGRNCRFLQGPQTDPERIDDLRRAVAAEQPVTVELRNHRRDGSVFFNEVHVSPVRDARGRVVRFVGVQVDVTAYRTQERRFALEQDARRAAEAAERRSAFLAAASPLLDASLDLRTTLDSLARLSVPYLGDVCLVDVVEDREVQRIAAAAADPTVERLLRALPDGYPAGAAEDDPVARVVATGRSEVVREGAERVFGPVGAELRSQVPRAALVVPLRARGRAIGVLVLAALGSEQSFGRDDLAIAEDLGRRAALALDNARLFEHQSSVARTLQESLLPERLPEIAGLDLAARFRPAGDGTEIGGDFYDAFPTDDGLTIVIGDVTGKGAGAASLTALSRHTLRTAGMYEQTPSGMLRVLNDALLQQRSARGKYCTVALARLAADGRALVACAGHPLPLVLRADGSVEQAGRPGTLLGWVDDPRVHDVELRLAPGDALVLYTDGLNEARTADGLLGDERLAAILRGCAGMSAGAIAARLEHAAFELQRGRPRDDIAIAVARVR
jgi:PAS domain S-box-containing protein